VSCWVLCFSTNSARALNRCCSVKGGRITSSASSCPFVIACLVAPPASPNRSSFPFIDGNKSNCSKKRGDIDSPALIIDTCWFTRAGRTTDGTMHTRATDAPVMFNSTSFGNTSTFDSFAACWSSILARSVAKKWPSRTFMLRINESPSVLYAVSPPKGVAPLPILVVNEASGFRSQRVALAIGSPNISKNTDFVRPFSCFSAARRFARNSSALSKTAAMRRCSGRGGRGISKSARAFGLRRGRFAPVARDDAKST
jgi:hypothetical protein